MTWLSSGYRCIQGIAGFLFGCDFFISYSHKDGSYTPAGLASESRSLNFRVFLDKDEYVAGTDLRTATQCRYQLDASLDSALLLGASANSLSPAFESRDLLLRARQQSSRINHFLHGGSGSWDVMAMGPVQTT